MNKQPIRITAPLTQETARGLRAGESVLISGTIIAARDAAHKRLTETLERGEKLPVDLTGAVIYYVGPAPAKPGHPIGLRWSDYIWDGWTPTLLRYLTKECLGW